MKFSRAALALVSPLVVASTVMMAPAQADEWPPADAADVRAMKITKLHPDGMISASMRVRCAPEWEPADVSVQVNRSLVDYAEGFAQADVVCDDRWHRVGLRARTVSGTMRPGRVEINVGFSVTHVEFGDAAGDTDRTYGRLVRTCRP